MRRSSLAGVVFAVVWLLIQGASTTGDAAPQKLRRTAVRPGGSKGIDYSKFFHATKKHQGACVSCHRIPTRNWQQVREYPDVADYPGHDACVGCHRPQFFRSAKPPICSVCHSKVSPRDDVRFAFRNPASSRQFEIEFPHDKHQDVIAGLLRHSPPASSRLLFTRAAFVQTSPQDKTYNNCEICHVTRATLLKINSASLQPDGLLPDEYFFKSVPEHHSSCFNCHWKNEEPVASNCAGCHKPAPLPFAAPKATQRISWKFKHDGGGQKRTHVQECTTCHINITKSATLRGLKPDVPITSCSECHNREGLRLDVSTELDAIDKNRTFVCSYCHTSEVGKRDPPGSHYLIAGRKPLKRSDPR